MVVSRSKAWITRKALLSVPITSGRNGSPSVQELPVPSSRRGRHHLAMSQRSNSLPRHLLPREAESRTAGSIRH